MEIVCSIGNEAMDHFLLDNPKFQMFLGIVETKKNTIWKRINPTKMNFAGCVGVTRLNLTSGIVGIDLLVAFSDRRDLFALS